MALRDLIPWNRGRELAARGGEDTHPFLALHREMNRLFDEAFRGFGLPSWADDRDGSARHGFAGRNFGWPSVEVEDGEKAITVRAELPGLEQKDVEIALENGALVIRGEKKHEASDETRLWSERYYGRFERHIPVEDVEEEKAEASFRNGVLTVTLPKSPAAQKNVRRIAINSK
jgi:HSP20 family protein